MIEISGNTVRFRLRCPDAQWICLAGDFNDWSPSAHPMKQVETGVWETCLTLASGDYRFRYYTSHSGWITDWAAFGVERNPFGEWNSIVHVPQHAREVAPHPSTTDAQIEPAPTQPNLRVRSVADHHVFSA